MSEYQWKTVSVVGFDELMQTLDRADRKGYMPDAIKEEWEAFNWKPEQPAQQEPVGRVISEKVYSGFGEHRPVRTVQWKGTPPPVGTALYTAPPARKRYWQLEGSRADENAYCAETIRARSNQ